MATTNNDGQERAASVDRTRTYLSLVACDESAGRGRTATALFVPLLPRIAAGDETAVRACVERYGSLVWSLARRWSTNAADAEDAVQEVFIDLWRNAARFDVGRATEPGWVAMVTRRRLIDRARRRKRGPALEPFVVGFDAEDEHAVDHDIELDHASRADRARGILRVLPDVQRRLLELSLLDGKTHDEIARETALPLGTVKSHIRRGLRRARALLAPDGSINGMEGGA